MPSVEFHTGVGDVTGYCCRLLRKAYRRGVTVLCVAPRATLESLDRALWTFDERDFVPHVRLSAGADPQAHALAPRTPIWLAERVPQGGHGGALRDVLVSVAGTEVADAGLFPRVIEIVAASAAEADSGRELWRRYRQAGAEIVHHPGAGAGEG